MKKISLWTAVLLALSVLPLSAAPLKTVRTESFRPDARPGAEFKNAGNTWSVKLDEKTGDFGKWTAFYQLPEGAEACRFQVRHNAGMEAVLKNLIICTVNWLDAKGNILRSATVDADKNGVLKGLITIKDIENAIQYPNSAKDANGRLLAGAAVGVSHFGRADGFPYRRR